MYVTRLCCRLTRLGEDSKPRHPETPPSTCKRIYRLWTSCRVCKYKATVCTSIWPGYKISANILFNSRTKIALRTATSCIHVLCIMSVRPGRCYVMITIWTLDGARLRHKWHVHVHVNSLGDEWRIRTHHYRFFWVDMILLTCVYNMFLLKAL